MDDLLRGKHANITTSMTKQKICFDQKDDEKRITLNLIKIFQKLENSLIFHVG